MNMRVARCDTTNNNNDSNDNNNAFIQWDNTSAMQTKRIRTSYINSINTDHLLLVAVC